MMNAHLKTFDIHPSSTGDMRVTSPLDGEIIGTLSSHKEADVKAAIKAAKTCFEAWRLVPAPRRGELIRLFGEELRKSKDELGTLVTLESGKILAEGKGEVQEMIDICDFAVGLSRQLYGLTIASERPGHRMMETWHPLGPVATITPFNFPVAVWCWNFALAIVCGNPVIWKPSEKTPFTALACAHIFERALARFQEAPPHLLQVVNGSRTIGSLLVESKDIPLISATGSTEMGRYVGERVALRFGKSLLELGGNNAMILTPSADLDLAIRAITFAALGTAGQRCTTLRRLIVHKSLYATMVERLKPIWTNVAVGNPLEEQVLMGPLIDEGSFQHMQKSLKEATEQGGKIHGGERVHEGRYPHAYYVKPALVEMAKQTPVVISETFSPILYVLPYDTLEEALQMNNAVPQGLSSCIFSTDVRECETFLANSDCGIANVNIGPSGAEIGGAFGGEKETGGGRESGSDSWRNYMRRATNTINYSKDLPLAQGITFDVN